MIVAASPVAIRRAAELLRAGECVAFPTETVYGLGADATNPRAVAHIFTIKQRPRFDPLIVHIADPDSLGDIAGPLPAAAQRLVRVYWPGPLTIVVAKTDRIPDIVTAGLPAVAVRIPDHPVALEMIRQADRPIAAPSANPFGYVSPTRAAHVAKQLGASLPLILDGGECRVGLESTIVSFATDPPTLLRDGAITREAIEREIGAVRRPQAGEVIQAPGQIARHYSPAIPLSVVSSPAAVAADQRRGAALLSAGPVEDGAGFAEIRILSATGDLEEAAVTLFAAIRDLDESRATRIYAVATATAGIGRAIMDRLRRAAATEA